MILSMNSLKISKERKYNGQKKKEKIYKQWSTKQRLSDMNSTEKWR